MPKRDQLIPRERRILEIYVSTGEYMQRKSCALYLEETGDVLAGGTLSKLIKTELGKAYIEELQHLQGIKITAVRNKVVEEYSALAFSNLSDVVQVGEHGITVRAFDDLPKTVRSAIKTMKISRKKAGDDWEDVLEIQMHDKKGALDGLSNLLNLQRRIGEELNQEDEDKVLAFAGVNIIGPAQKKIPDLTAQIELLPEGED